MMRIFAVNLFEAIFQPRRSARRMIERAPELGECVLMVVLAFAIQSVAVTLVDLVMSFPHRGAGLAARLLELLLQLTLYFAMVQGAYAIGRRFEGRATREEIAIVVAWHSLVTAFLAPINAVGFAAANPESGLPEGLVLLLPASVGVSVWLFAQYIAEAHGFTRIGPVVAATVFGFIGLGFMAVLLAGIFGAAIG